ncbi:cytochrome P450 [Xylariaceae sp. FL1651]|nr:cytochrome P450 [Xylariaceae sp. FL1651]
MPLVVPFVLALGIASILTWVTSSWLKHIRYEQTREQLGCPPLETYPGYDKILGLDFVYAMMAALKEDRVLEYLRELYANRRSKVWAANFLGKRMVYTMEPEHIKALSTSHFENFAIEPIRVGNGAITPFTGRGVSSSDGARWAASRKLVQPYFDRAGYTNLERLRSHVDRLIDKIPVDGSSVDMQPLLQRWFLDTSTEFLFGESVNCIDHEEREWPRHNMIEVMKGLRFRLQLGSFLFLHRDKSWLAACRRIHQFLDGYIDKAYRDYDREQRLGVTATYANGKPRDDFLWTLVSKIPDKLELRTQLMGVWIPSNETTSILTSNVLFAMARYPRVVEKLRAQILAYGDKPISFEGLRSINYLRWIINETHRLYPVSLQTVRLCIKDTVLSSADMNSCQSPLFCAKGDVVHCNRYLMQRDKTIWGLDADEFRPERWKTARPLWAFVPFGGGSRICPAHVMVDTECSYTIFRIFQCFKSLKASDISPYTAVMGIGLSSKDGCKVSFVPQ